MFELTHVLSSFLTSRHIFFIYFSWIKNLHVPEAVRITTKFHKILYFQYTNETYTERIPNPGYMGFLGPPLYLCEGEALWIYFKNNASKDCSLHAHGLQYNKTHEGKQLY